MTSFLFHKLIEDRYKGQSNVLRFRYSIFIQVADDLDYWNVEIPGKVSAKAEALSGSMTLPGKRVQTINAPGSEVGPGTTAIWGRAVADKVNAMGYKWERKDNSSKHIPFDWGGSISLSFFICFVLYCVEVEHSFISD